VFILALAPLFSWLWIRLGSRQPSSPSKFTLGLTFVGLGMVLMTFAASLTHSGRVSPIWLGLYLIHTIGELCLSPIGLSTVTKLAPARMVGLMMGVWFLSLSIGNYAAGWAATFYQDDARSLVRLFGSLALLSLFAAGALCLLIPMYLILRGLEQCNRGARPSEQES
jgi:proton-dependent oligopeptide transporter, POT family